MMASVVKYVNTAHVVSLEITEESGTYTLTATLDDGSTSDLITGMQAVVEARMTQIVNHSIGPWV